MPSTDGDDLIDFISGPNLMAAGRGNDRYYIDDAGDLVDEKYDEGDDTIYSRVDYILQEGVYVEALSTWAQAGQESISLKGNSFSNQLWGNDGSNRLDGGGGGDHLHGLGGDDIYTVNSVSDLVFENSGQGRDTIYSRVSYQLAPGADVETLSTWAQGYTDPINLTGNELANELWGNIGSNRLEGGGGNDILRGLTGLLPHQDAVDVLVGGTGDDIYYVGKSSSGQMDTIIEKPGEGTDTIYYSGSGYYYLPGGTEIEFIILTGPAKSAFGNEFGQEFRGTNNDDEFYGRGGRDVFYGFGGRDWYHVDSPECQVYDPVGGGFDRVVTTTSFALTAGAEIELFTANDHGGLEAIAYLTGNEFSQEIFGNASNNILDGKGGSDLLQGNIGDDSYAFTTQLGPDNIDKIVGFAVGSDEILLDDAIFFGLSLGALPDTAFRVGAVAQAPEDRILFDPSTGGLFFDADGNGAQAAIQFAIIGPTGQNATVPHLTASDFFLI